jgi:hypothetical protein
LTSTEAGARERALDAVSLMRRKGISVSEAAAEADTTPTAMRRYAGTSLVEEHGRVRVTTTDRLYRGMMVVIDRGGGLGGDVLSLSITNSHTASLIGRHWNGIRIYVETGDASILNDLRGKTFTAEGRRYRLLTNLDSINEMGELGMFAHIEDIYRP